MKIVVSQHAIEKYLERVGVVDGQSARVKIKRSLSVVRKGIFSESGEAKVYVSGVTYIVSLKGDRLEVITCYLDNKAENLPGHASNRPKRGNLRSRIAGRKYRKQRMEVWSG